jgi:hypothetical protein
METQAQVNDAGVQRIDGGFEFGPERVVRVEAAGVAQQTLGQVGVDAPVALLVGVGQRGAMHGAVQPQMVAPRGLGVQTRFDVAEAFTPGELSEDQTDELLPAGELRDVVIAVVAADAAMKMLRMNPIEQLSEDVFSSVHRGRIPVGCGREVEIAHTPQCA